METGKKRRFDWPALKAEWLASSETLFQFSVRKGIKNRGDFYRRAKSGDWIGAKARINEKALANVEKRVVSAMTAKYSFQSKQWKTVEGIIARELKKLIEAKPGEEIDLATMLESLTRSLERALKAQKLIHGEPTGDPSTPSAPSHGQVVELLRMMKDKDPRIIHPESIIEGEIVE